MVSDKGIEDAIATRELSFKKDDGSEETVVVRIGKPVRNKNGEDWECAYEIASDMNRTTHEMMGIDSIQALFLTSGVIDVALNHWEKNTKGSSTF